MSDWVIPTVTALGTLLGAGAGTALVNGWNHRRNLAEARKTAAQEEAMEGRKAYRAERQEERKDMVAFLSAALREEKVDHSSCLERVKLLEGRLGTSEADSRQLRDLLLESYIRTTDEGQRDPVFMRRLETPPPRTPAHGNPLPVGELVAEVLDAVRRSE